MSSHRVGPKPSRSAQNAPSRPLPAPWRHSGGAAAVHRRPRHRREGLSQASARRRGDRRHFGDHHQCPFDRGRVLHLRGAAPRARHHPGRDRRPAADRQRHLGRRQPRSRAHRPHGGGGRRLGAPGVPAGAVHAAAVAGHGGRALQAHRRRLEPADHRLPVSAGDRPGLSARHADEDGRGGADASAPSRTGPAMCRSTRCISASCKTCRGRSTC